MYRYMLVVLTASALTSQAFAAENKFDAAGCAKTVAPYLDEQTFAVLHIDLTAVDADALIRKAAEMAKMDADALPFPRKQAAAAVKSLTDAGARDAFFVFSLADMPEWPPFLVVPLKTEADAKKLAAAATPPGADPLHSYGSIWPTYRYEAVGAALVGGGQPTFQRLRDLKPTAFPELAKALAAADGGLAQLAVFPPKDADKILDSVMPTLPAEVGGGSSRVLTNGFRWAAVGLDAPQLKVSITVQAADADSAKALLDLLKKTCAAVGKSAMVREAVPNFDALTELLTPKVADARLTLTLDEAALKSAIGPLLPKAEEASDQARSSNQLRQLVQACHRYLDDHGHFPAAAISDKSGKPLLSWRVQLLPYLGQDKLYKQFHLEEPWDSENNKRLIAQMPDVFRAPTADPKLAAAGKTTYLAPIGDATMFPPGRGVGIAEVTDGTCCTILFVEVNDDHAVPWTAPEDLVYDPKEPMTGLGDHFHGGFLAAFADGSAHFLPKSLGLEAIRGMFTRNGGEVVNVP
ncbi:MAG TPA: DUF1559 domain-containing protein [Gemmataceae bacterium]|nr:DUF1559 domain-containing protein [Gemmataceae bacterium]